MKSNMKKKIIAHMVRISDRLGVTPRELILSGTCVAIGSMYLFYSYLLISICH